MAQNDSFQQETVQRTEELSPVKRALVEIRQLRSELEASRRGPTEPVSILGMAVRLPGGVATPERFWEALAAGEELITAVPPERWDALSYASADSEQPGTMYDTHGGFLADVDTFDAEFFGIHPREASSMDPQHRILLELTWEALERANIDPRTLLNTRTGIYLGITNSDYSRMLLEDPRGIDGYTGVGAAGSIAAGRIAYFLGTHGPAVVVDTACSSSLVALHQAIQSLRRQETDIAIVGATNLILSPEMNIGFSRTRMLSRDGHCKTFDAAADGYVRSEGCCVIVLKRLADANRDGDRVLANLHGSAVNQDGRSAGITAPNGPAQEAVMREALANAALDPLSVSYVEAHGTGTPLGDPIEVQALGAVYGAKRSAESPLRIGSVKTNLGHTEAAAGLAGLVKVVLMMQAGHGIAPHLHFKQPNPQIDWRQLPIEVPQRLVSWPNASATRYAGVSSFGFSGTNAHVIVGSVESPQESRGTESQQQPSLLCISAADEASVRALAERYIAYLQQTRESFRDICHTAALGRAQLPKRIALIARNGAEAVIMLQSLLSGRKVAGLQTNAFTTNAMNSPIAATHNTANPDPLRQIQQQFVQDGRLQYAVPPSPVAPRKVDLPVYPFHRKRFWFGPTPQVKRQQEREQIWQSMRQEAERQSLLAPLGWQPQGYPERFRALDRLNLAHARNLLVTAGAFPNGAPASVDEVIERCAFQPIYRKLVQRWLLGLAQDAVLLQSGNTFRPAGVLAPVDLAPYWDDAARRMHDDPGALAYLRQCGALFNDVVTGRKSALETLFPDGSFALAEGLYESSAQARYVNPIVASALREVARRIGSRRSVRILELGGGTGGTTSAILPSLPADKVGYWFTDVSELFLSRARRKFQQYPFVRYMLCDVDRDFEQQGLQPGTFDVVVAANVIHAARNLDAALARVQTILSPEGTLVLLETTHHYSWFDMSTGLIEGWQHFSDSDRTDHPLLNVDQWHGILDRTGFAETAAFPSPESPASALGQHVLFARTHENSQALRISTGQAAEASRMERAAKPMPKPLAPRSVSVSPRLGHISSQASDDEVASVVKETICQVFQLDLSPEELGERDRLTDLGMDSLIALELRGQLAKRLGLEGKISSTIALDTGTVGELVRSLSATLAPAPAPAPPPLANRPRTDHAESQPSRRAEQQHLTVAQLEEMSEEEVEQLLRKRLSRQ
jgi:3-oxoacyl-(acyl-carrier-protein) synthase/SAM-dependent methyltransferase/acyl carrier protein